MQIAVGVDKQQDASSRQISPDITGGSETKVQVVTNNLQSRIFREGRFEISQAAIRGRIVHDDSFARLRYSVHDATCQIRSSIKINNN